jgi:sarcosine oxidase
VHLIVVGLGAVGGAAAWRLAEAGHRVTGFDRWAPPHAHGSTHGETRVTRISAWEGARYVPLVRRANALLAELPMPAGEPARTDNGALFLAPPDDLLVAGSVASAEPYGVPYELLDGDALRARWPHLRPSAGQVGFLDPGGGMLHPERIVRAMLARAAARGATLHADRPVRAWRPDGEGIAVSTDRGDVRADGLVLTAGAWLGDLLPDPAGGPRAVRVDGTAAAPPGVRTGASALPLRVERQTLHWFAPAAGARAFSPARAPVHVIADAETIATAVFPVMDGAIKVGVHGSGEFAPADAIERAVRPREVEAARRVLDRFFPGIAGAHLRSATCLYTHTPDGHFVLDRHPAHPRVAIGSACNGFGFKFAAASGEALARLATGEEPPVPLDAWRLDRFA